MWGISSRSDGAAKREKPPKKQKIKKIHSTTTILWRYFALFAFGVIAVIAIVCYGILSSSILSQSKRQMRSVGQDMIATLGDPMLPDVVVTQKIFDYSQSHGVDVYVFDAGGTPRFVGAAVPEDKLSSIYQSVEDNLSEWEKGKTVEYTTRSGKTTAFNFAACVSLRGVERCTMLVSYPVTHVVQSVRSMELYVILVAVAAFVVAFFISYSLAKKLSDPLTNLSRTAKRLASGNYDVHFDEAEYAEIAQLSGALNYMTDEIKKSDDFRKELVANVSHDLKTPLTMIKAYASMIREISGDDPEKRDKHLQVIIDEADRLTGLVNDILSTSKITAGLENINKKVFNLTELLYGVINKFSYLQETQGYKIMVDVQPNLYTLADEEQIYQVIYNLVSNAINYTGEDKTIFVSLKLNDDGTRVKFAVRDTGKGIAEEELAHIWDRYYRSKDSHLRPVKGTGLGLNIVKVILQKHAFDFGVNGAPPHGSTFFVDFPNVNS